MASKHVTAVDCSMSSTSRDYPPNVKVKVCTCISTSSEAVSFLFRNVEKAVRIVCMDGTTFM
jgi:hypothetical protein